MSIRRIPAFAPVAVLFVLTACISGQAQSAQGAAIDSPFHKFQPKVAPDRAVTASSAPSAVNGIGATAAQQMLSLQQDKAARTPAQRKIDSNIIYTTRMLAGKPVADGVPFLNTGIDLDENNNIVVDMVANVTDQLLQQLTAAGAQVLYKNASLRSIRASIPPNQIDGIASSPDVIFISPKQGSATARVEPPALLGRSFLHWNLLPGFEQRAGRVRRQLTAALLSTAATSGTGQGSVETEGDAAHRAIDARAQFGVNGSPLKIGVLSDGVSSLLLSQATGDLPPLCGAPPCVSVLPGQFGNGDEGTAMMEIIHDMAPGASLVFASADNGIASFAQNIRDLRSAGCDIIVDDVFYFVETPLQDGQASSVVSGTNAGVVIQAVNDAVAAGALYFSSAGNEGNVDDGTSGTFEGDFTGIAAASPLPSGKVHNFGSGDGFDAITSAGFQVVGLWWADPLGASSNDYDLYVLDSTGATILAASTNVQNGTQDAVELIGSSSVLAGNRLVVFQNTGAADVFFHLVLFRGGLTVNTTGETHGHSAASAAYTVAATPAALAFEPPTPNGPFPNPFTTANQIEAFSSDGLRHIFFNGDSTAITPGNFSSAGGAILNKPDITAADGVSVTGVGGFPSPFYGTSAAAPSAASVAALVKSAKPSLTAAQIRTALTSTAVDIMNAGFDRDSGAGIVMAFDAINSLGVTGAANPELGTVIAAENPGNGNGVIEAGEGASLSIQLKNTSGVKAATGITAALTSSNPSVIITQPATAGYGDISAGATGGSNMFTFTLASNFACGQTADFNLTLNYSGGSQKVIEFSVPVGILTINNKLGTKPPAPAGITTATGTQTDRLNRNDVVGSCGAPKPFPGLITSAPVTHPFDSYSFTACQATCMDVRLISNNGISLYESLYSPSFDPTNITPNYQGDASVSGTLQTFTANSTGSNSYTVVVNDVSNTSVGASYSLQIPVCALNCNVNHLPIAKAHDVTAIAAAQDGTAVASIDNGSSDPDGDPITLTQNPPGPYPVGITSNVFLNVTDNKGATSQATANITVINPQFGLALTLSSVSVTAGQTATEHITFTPNPGIGSPLTFSCSGLPTASTCGFSPASVPAGSGQTDITLTVTTTAASAALSHPRMFFASWMPVAGLALAGMMVIVAPKKRRTTLLMTFLLASLAVLALGCGGSHPQPMPGTPMGTFTVTVTGTSANVNHSANFTLTVM